MSSEKESSSLKSIWKKFWFILWKDDSFKGWIFSILFIFVFIKFLFFPILSLATGTSLPLAIVESCSMYHQGNLFSNFDNWFDNHEEKYSELTINQLDFQEFKLKNGFNKGDILFITGANPKNLEVGDIIIFSANQATPIIHRIINIQELSNGERTFSTIGDNNNGQLSFETNIPENRILGKASFKLAPYAGWIKLVFYDWRKPVQERGFCDER